MLKKLFITAAAAAALSVSLAGVAWADKPEDPGAGNQGVPDRATDAVVSVLAANGVPESTINSTLDAFESGNSGVFAPGTAYSLGAKTDCASGPCNTPDGYGVGLNGFYAAFGIDPGSVNVTDPGQPFGRTIPGQVTRTLTNGVTQGCKQHSTGTCLD